MDIDEIYEDGISVSKAIDLAILTAQAELILATTKLYSKMETISTLELYKVGRYVVWSNEANRIVNKLRRTQEVLMREKFREVYIASNPFNSPIDERFIQEALDRNWAGRNFSDSIWNNTELLKAQLEKRIKDNISSGKGIDVLSKELTERFGVTKSRADTLARTETQYFINQGQADRYIEKGIVSYEYLAEIDGKTTDICRKLDGKEFRFVDARVGINFPPLHVQCRSTIKPVID